MPIRYVCKNCGFELYRFEKPGQDFHGVRSPLEIIEIYEGKCPRCGHTLSLPKSPEDIVISVARKKKR